MLSGDAKGEDSALLRPVILSYMAETNAVLAQLRDVMRRNLRRSLAYQPLLT
jgi:hypothetical protein